MAAYLFSKLMDYSKARNRRIFSLVEILFPDRLIWCISDTNDNISYFKGKKIPVYY